MWRSWDILTCGFRVSEDYIFLVMLQRCVLKFFFFPSRAQFLCVTAASCLYVLMFFQGVRVGSSLSASHMESTMKLLRGRVQSRLALHKQFASLGTLFVNSLSHEIVVMNRL